MIYELAALGAALTWAASGLLSAYPSRELGALAFGRARMAVVCVALGAVAAWTGAWRELTAEQALLLALSGFLGVAIGDTALFMTMNRLGPRRSGVLFAMNAPMAALLGWATLGEALQPQQWFGGALAIAGVVLAVVYGKRPSQLHVWERVKGPLWVGVGLGLVAAAMQAVGALIARPVMAAGVDPIVASALRTGVAALGLSLILQAPRAAATQGRKLDRDLLLWTAASGLLGMAVGMTLLLFALQGGEVGVVTALSATTPALLLPIIWARTGERPALAAWLGAALAAMGSALILAA